MVKCRSNEHSRCLKSFHPEVLVASGFTSLGNDTCQMFIGWARATGEWGVRPVQR
jgi:hypothetical protein